MRRGCFYPFANVALLGPALPSGHCFRRFCCGGLKAPTVDVFSTAAVGFFQGAVMSEPDFTPTPRQIRQACRRLQATWSEVDERQHRIVYGGWRDLRDGTWTAPELSHPKNSQGQDI